MENAKISLSTTQAHMLRLTRKDTRSDGWTAVSKTVMTGLRASPEIKPPADLWLLEDTTEGRGRAKLTDRGNVLADYL